MITMATTMQPHDDEDAEIRISRRQWMDPDQKEKVMGKSYSVLVMGTVERRVIVRGKSLEEAEANACKEWANLTGGEISTAECVEAHEVVEESSNG